MPRLGLKGNLMQSALKNANIRILFSFCLDAVIAKYPGFLLYRGTYDSAPVSNKNKKECTPCLIVHIFSKSFALILGTKSRF